MRDFFNLRGSFRIITGIGLGLALNAASPAFAQDPATEAAETASVSTPAPKSSYKPYFFEFRARSAATYGHMYVLYGRVNGRGEIVSSDIAGLHPAGDGNNCDNCSVVPWTIGHVLFVPAETGASDGDLEEKYVSGRYRVMVDAATYKKVATYIAKLKAENPTWNALWRNCVSFGNDIAGNLGLKTPGFVWLEPQDYVNRLRELNGGKPQGPLRYAARNAPAAAAATGPADAVAVPHKKRPVATLKPAEAAR
jgi:hypothetical protein